MRRRGTYNFPVEEVVLSLAAVPFEAWTHVRTRTYHGDGFVEAFRDERIIHLPLRNRSLSLRLTGFHELEQKARARRHAKARFLSRACADDV